MASTRRPSNQTIAVLGALAHRPQEWRYGYELAREVGLKSGSLYPILMRLSDRECLESQWETDVAPGRPPRHLYRLTPSGLALAAEWVPTETTTARGRRAQVDLGVRGAW